MVRRSLVRMPESSGSECVTDRLLILGLDVRQSKRVASAPPTSSGMHVQSAKALPLGILFPSSTSLGPDLSHRGSWEHLFKASQS